MLRCFWLYSLGLHVQDAAGKVQGAAQTQYETAKDTASNLANKAQGYGKDAHGQAKVMACNIVMFGTLDESFEELWLEPACLSGSYAWA